MESPILIFIKRLTKAFKRLLNSFVSVPIFIKILGAGMFVVLIFGSIVLYRSRISKARTLYHELEDQSRTVAALMAASLERSMTIQDYYSAKLILDDAKQAYPNIEYAIIEDQSNRILAHTFEGNVPADLVELYPPARMTDKNASVEVLGSSKDDARMYPLYRAAEELRVPVMFHTGSSVFRGTRMKYGDPLHLDDVAVDFPGLPLVMAHAGRGFWYDRAFFLAKLHGNLYMEISDLPPSRLMTYFPELDRITDKVLFGSDWPGMPWIRRNMEEIGRLPLPADGVERILGGNAARLLGL